MDLHVFLTDHPGDPVDRPSDELRLSYAGSAVAGVVAELEVMVFEHPEQGWRTVGTGDIAYDAEHRRVFGRVHDRWREIPSPALQQALDRQLSRHRHLRANR